MDIDYTEGVGNAIIIQLTTVYEQCDKKDKETVKRSERVLKLRLARTDNLKRELEKNI